MEEEDSDNFSIMSAYMLYSCNGYLLRIEKSRPILPLPEDLKIKIQHLLT